MINAMQATDNNIFDLICLDEYCQEISILCNLEVNKIKAIAFTVIQNAKQQNIDDITCLEKINSQLLLDSRARTR